MRMREQLRAIRRRQEAAEEAVADAQRELTALLKPVIAAMQHRPGYITASEKVVSFYEGSDGLEVTTRYDRSDGTGCDHYHIPKAIMETEDPVAAADALVQRQRDEVLQRQRGAEIATLRKLQEQYPDA